VIPEQFLERAYRLLSRLDSAQLRKLRPLAEDKEFRAGHHACFQARSVTPVSTAAFPGKRIREACDQDPAMGYALMKQLIELVTEELDAARIQLLKIEEQAGRGMA
jgi:hypothetical protein